MLLTLAILIYATGVLFATLLKPVPAGTRRSYTAAELVMGALALLIWVLFILCLFGVALKLPACLGLAFDVGR